MHIIPFSLRKDKKDLTRQEKLLPSYKQPTLEEKNYILSKVYQMIDLVLLSIPWIEYFLKTRAFFSVYVVNNCINIKHIRLIVKRLVCWKIDILTLL